MHGKKKLLFFIFTREEKINLIINEKISIVGWLCNDSHAPDFLIQFLTN